MKTEMFISTPIFHLFVPYVHWHLIYSSFHLFLLMVKKCSQEKNKRGVSILDYRELQNPIHIYMKQYMSKLKNWDHIQFVKMLRLIAVLEYIVENNLFQFAWELDGLLEESKNEILKMKILEMNLLDAH